MASQWIPPLPAGYEARWDPNQRAYFFINHHTKQTSWQDPRFPAGGQQHQAAAQYLNQQSNQPSTGGGQNVAMTTMYKQFGSTTTTQSDSEEDDDWESTNFDQLFSRTSGDTPKVDVAKLHKIKSMFPSASEDLIKSYLIRHNNSEPKVTNQLFNEGYKRQTVSHPPPRGVDMVERLKAMFPDANSEMINDILSSSNNDEKTARNLLENIGFKPTFPVTHKSPSRSPARGTSPARVPSPARNKSATSGRATSPAKPKLTEAKKREIEKKIQGQFKTFDLSVVQMALQVCDYDETRVKAVLERMGDSSRMGDFQNKRVNPYHHPAYMNFSAASRPSTSGSRPGTSTSRARSPSPVLSPASLLPQSLFEDDVPRSSGQSTSDGRSGTPSRPATGKSRSPSPKKSVVPQQRTGHAQQRQKTTGFDSGFIKTALTGLNQLTDSINCCPRPNLPPSSTNTSLLVNQSDHPTYSDDSRQAHTVVSRQPQASEHRTLAKGPDPSLRQGPNKNLLLSEFTAAVGPNSELRQGPDPARVHGPQGALGPDPALHCGPQSNLAMGQGQRTLVTAI